MEVGNWGQGQQATLLVRSGTHISCRPQAGVMSLLGCKAQASRQALWTQKAKSRPWPGEKSQGVGSPGVPGAVSKQPSFRAFCIWEGRTLSRYAGLGSLSGRQAWPRTEGMGQGQKCFSNCRLYRDPCFAWETYWGCRSSRAVTAV